MVQFATGLKRQPTAPRTYNQGSGCPFFALWAAEGRQVSGVSRIKGNQILDPAKRFSVSAGFHFSKETDVGRFSA
jgi:hypothetical protein